MAEIRLAGMLNRICAFDRRHFLSSLLISPALPLLVSVARGEDAVALSLTIKDRQFDPAELHAPPGRAIEIHVKNLNPIVSEFESSDLHFEKIIPVGKEAVVRVRPQQPGRYDFFDDFHRETHGVLVVP
jgi:plastocyanin